MLGLRSCAAVLSVAALAAGAGCPAAARATTDGPLVVVEDRLFDCDACSPSGHFSLWVAFPGRGFHQLDAIGKRLGDFLAYRHAFEPQISPDGRLLAFAAPERRLDLARVDLGSDKVLQRRALITMLPRDYIGGVAWSPDGGRLAILGRIHHLGGLFVINLRDPHLHRLVAARQVDVPRFSGKAMTAGVAWSSRGQIAFVGSYPYKAGPVNNISIAVSLYMIGADGTGLRNLVRAPRRGTQEFLAPTFSPDGTHLIYQRDEGSIPMFVRDLASGRSGPLRIDGATPAYSPDGRRLAYSDGRSASDYTLVTVASLTGAHPMPIPAAASMRENSYIGDITWLAG